MARPQRFHQGHSQADVAIDSIPGGFEGGWAAEGQTKEHAFLAFTIGVSQMIVALNKMNRSAPTVWYKGPISDCHTSHIALPLGRIDVRDMRQTVAVGVIQSIIKKETAAGKGTKKK